jgi:hypothetical protein
VVSTDSAGEAIAIDRLAEKVQDRLRTIVAAGANACNEAGFAVDKAMNHNFEAYQACVDA